MTTTTTTDGGFALTGLMSRGGLSNWVFFFFPDALVTVDVGITPALKGGAAAGVLGQFGGEGIFLLNTLEHGPRAKWGQALRAWLEELRPKAKRVVTLPDADVRAVRLRMRMMAHELWLTGPDGTAQRFGLLNRKQSEATASPLAHRFGARFTLEKTPAYAFFEKYLPFLL